MAISLPVLALYAVSAKMRGDKIEEQNKALADQEKAKLDLENSPQYIIENDQGVPMLAPKNWFQSTSFSPEKIVKYRPTANDSWIDWTPEKSANTVPIFWDGITLFTAEEHPDKVKDAVQAGHRTTNVDGTYTDQTWDKDLWFNRGKTEPPPPTERQVYSFTVNGETYDNLEGQQGVTNKLTDLGIPRSMWPVIQYFSTVVKTDENENQIGVSQPTNVQLFGTPKDPAVSEEIKTPFYRTDQETDDGTFLEVEQSKYDPKKHGNITGSFSITKVGDTIKERTEITDRELANASAAIKQSDYLYSFKVGDETFGGLESISNTGNRILNVANQLNNSTAALKYLAENKDATNVIGFRRGLFADVLAEHETFIAAGEEIYTTSGLLGNMMIDTVNKSYPSLLNIPGFKDLVDAYDEKTLGQVESDKLLNQNSDPANNDTAVSSIPVPNPTSAVDPTAADTTIQVIQHSWPKTFTPLIDKRLLPVLLQSNLTGMMIGDKQASRETLANMALDNFINYEKGIDGRPLVNSNGNRIVSNDQPILVQFNDWANTSFNGNPNVDELAVFVDLVDPRESALNKQSPSMIPIARDFYTMTDGDILIANNIVYNMMPSSRGVDKAIDQHFGFGGSISGKEKFLRAQTDVAESSGRAINVVDAVLETYYMTDSNGQYVLDSRGDRVLLDSTAVANLSLFGQGVQYLAGRGADILGFSFGTSNSKDQMLNYVSSARLQLLQKFDEDGKPLFEEDADGLSLMEQELQRISEITDAKYAERQFYTVVLAYEIAAAIQGGTGGRTISDQDVAMIMRGLRQNFVASPQSQVNTLKGVKRMLQRFKFRADALSSGDPKRQLAYITTERLLNTAGYGDYSVNFTVGHVVDELGGGSSQKPQGKTVLDQTIATIEDGPAIYNAFVLGSINERRKLDGNPEYGTIDEAKQDMEPTLFESLMATANKNFITKYGVGQ